MPSIAYGTQAYRRTHGNFPPLELINMLVEAAPTSEQQVALISRQGLAQTASLGTGPINGLFVKPGTFSGDRFAVSNTTLYRTTTSLGAITGTGAFSAAGSDLELVLTRGATAYSYNGTDLAAIAFPDTANVAWVTYIGSLFVFGRSGSGKFYWSDPLDGRTVDALSFATAEREPDGLLDGRALGDNIWLFGQQTVEAWAHTGDSDLPFTRLENVAFDKGILATGCVAPADNSLFFVGSNHTVYRVGEVPQRISDSGIEEAIAGSASVRMFSLVWQGHELVCIRLDDETFAYDCSTQAWCRLLSQGGNWIVSHASGEVLGHATTGQIMEWSGWFDLGDEIERRFTAALPTDGPLSVDRLALWANSGTTDLLAGQGSDPLAEMRYSRDAGNTFTSYDSTRLGAQGEYRAVPAWRRLGMFDFPGALFEFRVTDPVDFRVSAVKVNDTAAGRSRG